MIIMEAAFMMHKDIIVDCSSLSVIRKKGESQNGGNKKTKHAKFSEKQIFITPWYAQVHVETKLETEKISPSQHQRCVYVETSHLFLRTKQMTGFYTKPNSGLT